MDCLLWILSLLWCYNSFRFPFVGFVCMFEQDNSGRKFPSQLAIVNKLHFYWRLKFHSLPEKSEKERQMKKNGKEKNEIVHATFTISILWSRRISEKETFRKPFPDVYKEKSWAFWKEKKNFAFKKILTFLQWRNCNFMISFLLVVYNLPG